MKASPRQFDLEALEPRLLLSGDGLLGGGGLELSRAAVVADSVLEEKQTSLSSGLEDSFYYSPAAQIDDLFGIIADGASASAPEEPTATEGVEDGTTESDSEDAQSSTDPNALVASGPNASLVLSSAVGTGDEISNPLPAQLTETLRAANGPPEDAVGSSGPLASGPFTNTTLSSANIQAILDGLQALGDWANELDEFGELAMVLPFVGASIGQSLDIGEVLLTYLRSPVASYLTPPNSQTTDGLVAILQGLDTSASGLVITVSDASVGGGLDGNELRFNLTFQATRTLQDIGISIGGESLGLSGGGGAMVDLVASLSFDFSFGVDLSDGLSAADAFFVHVNDLTASADVHESNLGTTINIGFLGADLLAGDIDLDADLNVAVANPDNDPGGHITEAELLGTSLENLVAITTANATLDGMLVIQAALGSFATTSMTTMTLAGDPFAPTGPTVTINGPESAELLNFTRIGPSSMLGILEQVGNWLGSLSLSDAMGTNLPYVQGADFGSAINFETAFQEELTSHLAFQPGSATFSNAQELAADLASVLGLDPSVIAANYDPATDRLSYHIELTHDFAPLMVPVNLGTTLVPLNGISSLSMITLTASGTLALTIQVQLATTTVELAGKTLLPANGQLSGDAHFDLSVNGGAPVSVTVARDLTNVNRSQLIANINAALTAAGLTNVTASLSSNALKLTTTGPLAGASLLVVSPFIDPAVNQLGLSGEPITASSTAVGTISLPHNGRLSGDATFQIGINGAGPVTVNVTQASTVTNSTRNDLLTDIANALTAAGVTNATASLENNQLKIVSSGAQTGTPVVIMADPENPAATELGFAPHLLLATQTSLEFVFLDGLSFNGTVNYAANDIDASANFGFVAINITDATVAGQAAITVAPKGNAPKRLTDLFDALATAGTYFTTTTAGSMNLTLPVSVQGGLIPLGASPAIQVTHSNIFNAATVSLTYQQMGDLPNYVNLDFPKIKTALQNLGSFLGVLSNSTSLAFNQKLPLLNRKVSDLVGYVDSFNNAVAGLIMASPANLQQVEQLLEQALGGGAGAVTLQVGPLDFRFVVNFDPAAFSATRPMDLDLAKFAQAAGGVPNLAGVPNLVGNALLNVNATASLDLAFGFDLSQPANPQAYVHDSTAIAATARAVRQNMSFGASTGALGVQIQNGTATLGVGSNPNALAPLALSLSLAPRPATAGKYFNIPSLTASIATSAVTGEAHATLPIFYPTPSASFGTVQFNVGNLANINGTTTLTSPNFAGEIASIDLLNDLGSLVNGLDQVFSRLDEAMKSQILGLTFPIVGQGLKTAFNFIDELRSNVVQQLNAAFNNGQGPKTLSVVENALTTVLQNLGLISGGTMVQGTSVLDGNNKAQQIQFNVTLSKSLTASQPIGFDLGIPGLGLAVDQNSAVTVMLGYTFNLRFGVSRNDGVYFDTSTSNELSVNLEVTIPGLSVTGELGFLTIHISDSATSPSSFSGAFTVDLKDPVGSGNKLTLNELLSGSASPTAIFTAGLNAVADVNLLLVAGFGNNSDLPSLEVDFHLGWNFNGANLTGGVPVVQFNNIRLNLGEFISGLVAPILDNLTSLFEPLEPFIEVLDARLPVISDLLGRKFTMLDLAGFFGSGAETAAEFIEVIADILAFADTLESVGNNVYLDLGTFNFNSLDLRQPRSQPLKLADLPGANLAPRSDTMPQVQSKASSFYESSTSIGEGGFSFPILENPLIAFNLFFNQDVDLFIYDMPTLDFTFQYTQFIPIYAFFGIRFGGSVNVTADFAFGYDTYGIRKYVETGEALRLFDGFYVADWVGGSDVPEVVLTGKLLAGAGADIGVASVFVDGGVFLSLEFDLNDIEQDGKFRGKEILDRLGSGIFCLFNIHGEIGAFLQIEVEIGICPICISISQEIARVTMITFDITCDPPPVLAELAPDGTLTLNMGPRAGLRQNYDTDDGDESFRILRVNDNIVIVEAFGFSQAWGTVPRFDDPNGPIGPAITKIVADGGNGNDSIEIDKDLTDPVMLAGGPGNDLLIGGAANDVLEGGTGEDKLRGGDGNDDLYGHSVSGSGDDNADDNLRGGNGNDTLHGNGGHDILFGEMGDDDLFGDAGMDQLNGGPGQDELHGGADGDALYGNEEVDQLLGDGGDDHLFGGDGDDQLEGGAGKDVLAGEAGTDALYGHSASGAGDDNGDDALYGGFVIGLIEVSQAGDLNDVLHGQSGADLMFGNEGDDFIFGEDGNDTIRGGNGNDLILGGNGHDKIFGEAGEDFINAEVGDDTVSGGSADDTVYGGPGNDKLDGDAGEDDVYGEDGNDTIRGGTGVDTLIGGLGNDVIRGQEQDDQIFGQADEDDLFGDDGNDLILGHAQDDVLHGGRGNDRLEAGDGDDTAFGNDGEDHIFGEAGADSLFGSNGDDYIDGGVGVDNLYGGDDNDYLFAGAGLGGVLDGGDANDRIVGSDDGGEDANFNDAVYFGDRIFGGPGDDTIWGLGGADSILGGGDNDTIDGGANGDRILGEAGNDVLYGGVGNDRLEGGAGEDFLDGGADTDTLLGGDDDDELLGGGGAGDNFDGGNDDDILRGSDDGADVLTGGAGRDRIFGNGGNDTIFGGTGDDIIDGGSGDDTIEGGAGSDLIIGGADHDIIYGHSASGVGDDNAVDYLYGDFGTNGSEGGSGQDQLFGQGGNDFLFGDGSDDFINAGGGGNNFVDYGSGEGGNPADFAPPVPTANPPLSAVTNPDSGATLLTGPDYFGRWTEFAGSGSGVGVSGHPGASIEPSLVANQTGGQYVAWADSRNGNFEIYVLLHSAGIWQMLAGSAQTGGVSNTLRSSRRPSITIDANGNAVVAWTEFSASGSEIFVAGYDPNANGGAGGWVALGSSLGAGGISGSGGADNAIIVNTSTGLVVAWEDNSSGATQVYVRRFSGGVWTTVGAGSASVGGISNSASGIRQLSFTTNGGNLAAAWTQRVAGIDQIYLREFSGSTWNQLAGSAFGNGLSNASFHSSAPTVAYHTGSLFVAWQQDRDTNTLPTGIYAARFNGAWVAAGTGALGGDGVSNSAGVAVAPKLASNGGKLHLLWTDETTRINQAALFARVWNGSSFAEELPGDASGQGISETGGQSRTVAVAVDQNGHPFVAWEETESGSPEIYLRGNTFDLGTVYDADGGTSIQSILNGNDLGPGDVILVAAGTYGSGFTVGAGDAGVLILGAPFRAAGINAAVTINSAAGVILQRLTLSGGVTFTNSDQATLLNSRLNNTGITLNGGSGIQVLHNTFSSSVSTGIRVNTASDGRIAHNTITASGTGINIATTFTGLILDNDISDASTGVAYASPAMLKDNFIHDNATGVNVTVTGESNGLGFVGGAWSNEIFDNGIGVQLAAGSRMRAQHVFSNGTGVTGSGILGGNDFETANLIELNSTGVNFSGTIQFNRIARNGTGINATNGQRVLHNLIYRNTQFGILVSARNDVMIFNNTLYAPAGDNIRILGSSHNVEVRSNILWAESGYDIYVSNDSQTAFFSDYNDLHVSGTGRIGYWTKDFFDILDWQEDIARFDLHSIGRTVINPFWSEPAFLNRALDDYRIFGLTAGQRFSSPTIDSADPRTDLGVLPSYQNLLTNPGFETGVTGWTVNPGAATQGANPSPFVGAQYFFPGNIQDGSAQQIIGLVAAGFSAAQLDGEDFEVVFGGRIRSLAEALVDKGQIRLTFLDAGDAPIRELLLTASNATDRWELAGDRVQMPVGTRKLIFRFEALRFTGTNADSFLDNAFVYVVSENDTPNLGADGHTVSETPSALVHIALRFPDLYEDWEKDKPLTIQWDTFGNTTESPVRVELYQDGPDGPALLTTIAASTPDDGEHIWIPSTSGINFGTYGLRIRVSLIGNSSVYDRSTEPFTVPESGSTYWVDDASNANDEYTPLAIGSNRHTGKLATAPKPNPVNLLRVYAVTGGATINVDTGAYPLIYALTISGSTDVGLGLDEALTLRGPANTARTVSLFPAIPGNRFPAIIDVNDADFVTLFNVSAHAGQRGVWVRNGSDNFNASYVTAFDHTQYGIHIETNNPTSTFHHLTAYNNALHGIHITGTLAGLNDSLAYNNTQNGFNLDNQNGGVMEANVAYGNLDGLSVRNVSVGPTLTIGNANLASGRGNLIHDNRSQGIESSGLVLVVGNSVFGHSGSFSSGIRAGVGEVSFNVVYDNTIGINGASVIANNRVYANSIFGIRSSGVSITGNVVYSNGTGVEVNGGTVVITNNLVYANSVHGLVLQGGTNHQVLNNTIYQLAGDAAQVNAATNVQVRNNLFWTASGVDLRITTSSQPGFTSDYNLFFITGTGKVGHWQNVDHPTLIAWRNASVTDGSSLFRNPMFVDVDGADNIPGFSSANNDGRDDDFHLQSQSGSFHGGALAPALNIATGLPVLLTATLTNDASQSPAIDRGDPASSFANETAPNGGFINLGAYGNTAQASRSPTQFLMLLQPDDGETAFRGFNYPIRWRSLGLAGDVKIEYSSAGLGGPFVTLAPSEANDGQFDWFVDPAVFAVGSQSAIRIISVGTPAISDTSFAVFNVANPITAYYVDDASDTGDEYTVGAMGNDANDGLTPLTPKATIRAILEAYDLEPGNVIYVDTGAYALTINTVLAAQDSGVTIQGPTGTGHDAILNRGNPTGFQPNYIFEFTGGDNVTINKLTLTNSNTAVFASSTADSDFVTVSNSRIFGNNTGINLPATNDDAVVAGNSIFNNATNGAILNGLRIVASSNDVYGNDTGINASTSASGNVTGNTAHDNITAGLRIAGTVVATGNIVYGHTGTGDIGIALSGGGRLLSNTVYQNNLGIQITSVALGSTLVSGNRVFANTTAGIHAASSGARMIGNEIYSNAIGIQVSQGITASEVTNNLIYANTTHGLLVQSSNVDGLSVVNNTIYQPLGNAVRVETSAEQIRLRSNILWVESGYAISVSDDSQNGFTSDYNLFHTTGTGRIGFWESREFTNRNDWFLEIGLDEHSLVANPQFFSPFGVDAAMGYDFNFAGPTQIIDNGDPGFSKTGAWTLEGFGFDGENETNAAGSGQDTASWNFTGLIPGEFYQVAITWPATATLATNAPFQVLNGTGQIVSVAVNQRIAPADFSDAGAGWRILGMFSTANGTLTVRLTDLANGLVVADAVRVQRVGQDAGQDDDFHLQSTSPGVDRGDPLAYFLGEPSPNGWRIDVGAYGNTPEATPSPAAYVQVLAPNGLDKLEAGQATTINWRAIGLAQSQAVLQIDSGTTFSAAYPGQGNWLGDNFRVQGGTSANFGSQINTSFAVEPAPESVYFFYLNGVSGVGNGITYAIPLPDGSYTVRLHFAEPSFGVGGRVFDIKMQGNVVRANYDIRAAAGATNRAVVESFNNIIAAGNSGLTVNLANKTSTAILCGIEIRVNTPGGVVSPTANLELSTDNGTNWTTIASNRGMDRYGVGNYQWTAGPQTMGSTALIRVTANQGTQPQDVSDEPFLIGASGNTYYVNDGSLTGDEYTTAPGNNANSGKSPDQPLASVGAVVRAFDLDLGDLVLTDTGLYNLAANILIGAQDSGVTVKGPVGVGHAAVINRGNTTNPGSTPTFVFELRNADDITLDHLDITGAFHGVGWNSSSFVSHRVTISNSSIHNNANNGILLFSSSNNSKVLGNKIYNNGATGVSASVFGMTVSGNEVYGNVAGIAVNSGTVSGNLVHDNSTNGIGSVDAMVTGNTVYGHSGTNDTGISGGQVIGNTVYRNFIGIDASVATDNRVYANSSIGIRSTGSVFGTSFQRNIVYSNGTGISLVTNQTGEVSNNLIYANATQGLLVGGSVQVLNNTIYQLVGDAVRIQGNNTALRNNLLWVAAGYGIHADGGPTGFSSDYNLFFTTGAGKLGRWETRDFTNRSDWFYELGLDKNGLVADPLFIEPAGVDGFLGYDAGAQIDRSLDDDFHLQGGSPAIDRGDPLSYFLAEPGPNGGRVDLGAYGNTSGATPSAAQLIQVVSPNGLEKFEAGQSVPVSWHGFGLAANNTVALINAGGATVSSADKGDWLFHNYRVGGSSITTPFNNAVDLSEVTNPAPEVVYRTFAASGSTVGSILAYALPVPDGAYTIRLHFVEPSIDFNGFRLIDIRLQGVVAQSNYDIRAAAGARYKATTLSFGATASGGSGILLELINQAGGAIVSAIELTSANPGGVATPTATLELSTDSGTSWSTLATGLTMNRSGNGSLTWAAALETNGNTGLIRARAELFPNPQDTSDAPFLIANAGTAFYVNDGSLANNEYTTGLGNNFNSGKSPDQPMSGLAAVLRAYNLDPGDIIYFDSGVYNLATNIFFVKEDSNVRVQGPVVLGHAAVLHRGNTSGSTASAIQFIDADDVTLDHLDITGGRYGIFIQSSDGSARLTVTNSSIHDNADSGIQWQGNSSNPVFIGNKAFNNSSGAGISGGGLNPLIMNNEAFGNSLGLAASSGLIEGNLVHDNTNIGIAISGTAEARGNTVFGQSGSGDYGISLFTSSGSDTTKAAGNIVYGNYIGINQTGGGNVVIENNRVYRNTNAGIRAFSSPIIRGNVIYSNPVGVLTTSSSTLYNNLIYSNTNQGVLIQGGNTPRLINNTIYQPVGDAVKLESSAQNVTLTNNILWVDVGFAINVANNSQTGFVSDYNLFYRGAASTGSVGTWGAVTRATLADWQAANSRDAHSLSGDPLFIDINGPDNVLGDPNVPEGNGLDDNFGLRANSPAIDVANAYALPGTQDLLGLARRDDPARPNTGIGWENYVEQNTGNNQYGETGVVPGTGGDPLITLPFTFHFWGSDYTQIRIARRYGFIQLGDLNAGFDGNNSLDALKPKIRIAPLWDNHQLGDGNFGGLFVDSSVPNQYKVRWSGTSLSTGGPVNFSVTLFADGSFRFDYGAGNQNLTPTIGISAGNGFIFAASAYNGQGSLDSANSVVWNAQPGLTWFDIGAYEFQGISSDVTPPQVTSVPTLPPSGGNTGAAISSIRVNFTERLDIISANSVGNYALIEAGPDGNFNTTDDVVVALQPSYAFATTYVTLGLPGGVLPLGKYRLTLSGTKAIYDTAGNPLDGDANGVAGGDYVHFFNIKVPPVLLSMPVNNGSPQRSLVTSLTLQFSTNVSASLTLSDLLLHNLTTGNDVDSGDMSLTYDPVTNRVTLMFPGLAGGKLEDGNYRLTVAAAGVTDVEGTPLTADQEFDFHVLTGDVNGDRVTNDRDLYRVWQNLLKAPAARDLNEDLNGDNQVTSADVNVVKNNYLASLPAPAPLLFAPAEVELGPADSRVVAPGARISDLKEQAAMGVSSQSDNPRSDATRVVDAGELLAPRAAEEKIVNEPEQVLPASGQNDHRTAPGFDWERTRFHHVSPPSLTAGAFALQTRNLEVPFALGPNLFRPGGDHHLLKALTITSGHETDWDLEILRRHPPARLKPVSGMRPILPSLERKPGAL